VNVFSEETHACVTKTHYTSASRIYVCARQIQLAQSHGQNELVQMHRSSSRIASPRAATHRQQKEAINSFSDFCSRGPISQRANRRREAAWRFMTLVALLAFSFHSASHAKGSECAARAVIHLSHRCTLYIMQNRKRPIFYAAAAMKCVCVSLVTPPRHRKREKSQCAATFYLRA
jgi:hypothetical protein